MAGHLPVQPGPCTQVLWAAIGFLDGGRILPVLPHVEAQLMECSSPIIDLYLEIGKQRTFAGVIDMFAAELSARIGAGSRPGSRRSTYVSSEGPMESASGCRDAATMERGRWGSDAG